jgi:hypothetical protein
MKLDPNMHIGMHLVSFGKKSGVTTSHKAQEVQHFIWADSTFRMNMFNISYDPVLTFHMSRILRTYST